MNIITVRTKIAEILDALTGSGASDPIRFFYSFPAAELEGFPAATLHFLGGTEEIMDSVSNLSKLNFGIRLHFQNLASEETFDTAISTIQSVLSELRKDDHDTLDGACEHFRVSNNIETRYTDDSQPEYLCDIIVTAEGLSLINQ